MRQKLEVDCLVMPLVRVKNLKVSFQRESMSTLLALKILESVIELAFFLKQECRTSHDFLSDMKLMNLRSLRYRDRTLEFGTQ